MITRKRIRQYYTEHPYKAFAVDILITMALTFAIAIIFMYVLHWPWWTEPAVWIPAYLIFVFGRFHPALRSRKEIEQMKAAVYEFDPDWVVPPGALLKEALEERGWDEAAFALRVGLTAEGMDRLLDGTAELDEEMANRLEIEFGIDARVWLNLERNYREGLGQGKTII